MKAMVKPFKKKQRIHENFRSPREFRKFKGHHDGLFRKSRKLKQLMQTIVTHPENQENCNNS
jgi:hypothetical protein